jgi:hypothetical protein
MDIEGPHKPIESLRDFLLHLLTITIGILIALTLEALVHDHRDKALVHEAVVSLDAEVEKNQAKLIKHRNELTKLVDDLNHLENEVKARRAGAKSTDAQIDLYPPVTLLSDTAWESASATQAVSLMGFEQAQRYAPIYSFQRAFLAYQDKSLDVWLDALSSAEDDKLLTPAELAEADHNIKAALIRARAFIGLDDAFLNRIKEH